MIKALCASLLLSATSGLGIAPKTVVLPDSSGYDLTVEYDGNTYTRYFYSESQLSVVSSGSSIALFDSGDKGFFINTWGSSVNGAPGFQFGNGPAPTCSITQGFSWSTYALSFYPYSFSYPGCFSFYLGSTTNNITYGPLSYETYEGYHLSAGYVEIFALDNSHYTWFIYELDDNLIFYDYSGSGSSLSPNFHFSSSIYSYGYGFDVVNADLSFLSDRHLETHIPFTQPKLPPEAVTNQDFNLWNTVRDFYVRFLFGGTDSQGTVYSKASFGSVPTSSFEVDVGGNTVSIGDWLSSTLTVITFALFVLVVVLVIRWIAVTIGNSILGVSGR